MGRKEISSGSIELSGQSFCWINLTCRTSRRKAPCGRVRKGLTFYPVGSIMGKKEISSGSVELSGQSFCWINLTCRTSRRYSHMA